MSGKGRLTEITVKDRIEPSTWLWLSFGLLVVLAAPWLLTAAGTGEVTVSDRVTGLETQTYAWVGPLMWVLAALGCPLLLVIGLFFRGPAVRLNAERIQLRGKSKVFARWDEVDRIVLWRRRVRRFGLIPGWEPQVAVVPNNARTKGFQQVASGRQWDASDLRPNGVPEWLPGGVQKRSVRLSYRCGPELAAGIARFAPDIPVVDERDPGQATPVEPR
ncbi:hypothetical protein DFP74_0633 [Nocardiopsis sp. Huas11]|uniref:hypothetical protein n=1 Tax=Nocardiopsis sp. Huas11 TaxID=2183912 RepID=UPI000EAF5BF6|nr:hypothetical protein [Nocardiopsis sp. Huas11]RKS05045.1 hypothetical protein DFP74_0633 [Nocardiopsis sp. Huas11]